jgi:hypothetical protein
MHMGNHGEARRLADDELRLARAFGAPRSLGIALRAAGLVEGGDTGLELLRESVAVLDRSPAALERARALVDLGKALWRANRRMEARPPLRRGLEMAQRFGALPLERRAHEELLVAGARPRRRQFSGVDALTPSERRVAEMAAQGLSNREIAQALFVTVKAVQFSSRQRLPQARRALPRRSRGGAPASASMKARRARRRRDEAP